MGLLVCFFSSPLRLRSRHIMRWFQPLSQPPVMGDFVGGHRGKNQKKLNVYLFATPSEMT